MRRRPLVTILLADDNSATSWLSYLGETIIPPPEGGVYYHVDCALSVQRTVKDRVYEHNGDGENEIPSV